VFISVNGSIKTVQATGKGVIWISYL